MVQAASFRAALEGMLIATQQAHVDVYQVEATANLVRLLISSLEATSDAEAAEHLASAIERQLWRLAKACSMS